MYPTVAAASRTLWFIIPYIWNLAINFGANYGLEYATLTQWGKDDMVHMYVRRWCDTLAPDPPCPLSRGGGANHGCSLTQDGVEACARAEEPHVHLHRHGCDGHWFPGGVLHVLAWPWKRRGWREEAQAGARGGRSHLHRRVAFLPDAHQVRRPSRVDGTPPCDANCALSTLYFVLCRSICKRSFLLGVECAVTFGLVTVIIMSIVLGGDEWSGYDYCWFKACWAMALASVVYPISHFSAVSVDKFTPEELAEKKPLLDDGEDNNVTASAGQGSAV